MQSDLLSLAVAITPQHRANCRQEYQSKHYRQSFPVSKAPQHVSAPKLKKKKKMPGSELVPLIFFICHCHGNYTFNKVSYSLDSYAGDEKAASQGHRIYCPKKQVWIFNFFIFLCSVICFYTSYIRSPLRISNHVISLSFASRCRVAAGAGKSGGRTWEPHRPRSYSRWQEDIRRSISASLATLTGPPVTSKKPHFAVWSLGYSEKCYKKIILYICALDKVVCITVIWCVFPHFSVRVFHAT